MRNNNTWEFFRTNYNKAEFLITILNFYVLLELYQLEFNQNNLEFDVYKFVSILNIKCNF